MNTKTLTRIKRLALALCLATPFVSRAAEPVAVWDGDFSTMTKGTYTLSENGNTKTDTYLEISGDNGILLTSTDALNVFTVIARCEGLNLSAEKGQVLFTSYANDTVNDNDYRNLTGVNLPANNAVCRGIWSCADWNNNEAEQGSVPANYTTLIYNHQQTKGTYAYALGPTSDVDDTVVRTTLYSVVGLRSSGTTYKGFAIGGLRGTTSETLLPATGLKVTSIAVFSGTLTEAEMKGYYFPSEIQTINVSTYTSVSAINDQFDSANYKVADVTVADGVTITVDKAFGAKIRSVSSTGTITLSAESQPDASYFSGVDFSGVQGALLRSWLTPGVVGFNFNANGGRNGQGTDDGAADTSLALEIGTWYKDAYSPSGSSTAMFADGVSLLTWKANNVYAEAGSLTSGTFIQGYLDDGGNVSIKLSAVPYEEYDVIIYCSTDDSSKSFKAKTVNGTIYTWDSTKGETTTTASDTATWGLASAAAGKAVYGANTLRINGLTGSLSILGGTSSNNARGCISAIQIMPAGTSTAPEMTVGTADQTTQANWTDALWNVATAPTSGNVVINVSGDVELTVDETVELSAITVNGEGSLKIIPDQQNSVTLTASSISSAVPLIFANDGIVIDTISASVTYTYTTTSISSSTHGNTYIAGAGSQDVSVAISHNGGSVILDGTAGETYYLSSSDSATATTVEFNNATATYSTSLGVGAATYVVSGQSVITAGVNSENPQSFVLSQGGAGRSATFLLKDTSVVNVTGTSDVDSNQASIMFGHWNGPSTFTIQDSAKFNALCQVLVGKTANTQTININGGTFTAKGIKASAAATGTNTLNLNGGLLVLGDVGIASYGSTIIRVNVLDDSEIRASAATLPITQPVAISAGETISFSKDSGVEETTVSITGAVTGTGNISVGSGVTLNLGTNRPEGEISVEADGVLAVVLASKADTPVLKVSSEPSNVKLYDTDGTTEISGATVDYDGVAGTITVKSPVPRWTTQSDSGSFDTDENWSTGSVPTEGDVVIELSQDTTISISDTYTLSSLTITGTGKATLDGTGSVTAGTVYVIGGTTLAHSGQIKATDISLASGTVLSLADVQEDAAISGAGAVETYGEVTFNASNTFTGGLTVKPGSTARTIKTGIGGQAYGKNNYGQAIANLSRIVVEDGGSLDLANTKDSCYAITIAGKGVNDNGVYKGALYNSGTEIGSDSRQTASLTLTADAMVKAEASNNGWGLVNSGHAASVLALNGHTLTVSGAGYFPIVNANTADGTTTTGTLIADGVTLGLVSTASNLDGVDIVAKGCATINLATAPTALGSLTIKPSATGTTASAWSLPAGLVPVVDSSNIDTSGLTDGQELTLFTAPSALSASTITAKINGRNYTTKISGNTIKTTYHGDGVLYNFLHYDFNADNSIASDSTYNVGDLNQTLVDGKNGKAGEFKSGSTPWYDSNTAGMSPFHAGEMTVTALLNTSEASDTIIWNIGSTSYDNRTGIALIAKDSSTFTLVSWVSGGAGSDVVSVTGIDVIDNWHFVAIVADENGTTLYVDDKSASVATCLPAGINARGQFGSIHGSVKSYHAVGESGFLLDDWRVYDAALTAEEVAGIMEELFQTSGLDPASGSLEVTSTEETEEEAEADAKNKIVVPAEAEAAVNAATYAGYFIYDVTGEAGNYTVAIVGIDDDVVAEVKKNVADAIATGTVTEGKVTVAVKPGLYYGFDTNEDIGSLVEPELTLATGTEVQIAKPGTDKGFVNVRISVIPAPTND